MSEQVTEPAPAVGIALHDYVERLLLQVLAAMPPGWSALRDATLPGQEGAPPERLGLILVHPRVGVAVLDLLPGPTTEDAPLRLRRLLETSGWCADFGDLPPIIHLCVPLRALRGLETWLEQTFGEQPTRAPRRDDWVVDLQRLLGATPLLRSDLARGELPGRPARPRGTAARRPARALGLRGLLWFWGGLALVTVSGAAVLQFLGPLDTAAPGKGPELVGATAEPPALPWLEAGPAGPALPPLLLPALPAAEVPVAGSAPQVDRRDAMPDLGAEPPPQAAPPAETLMPAAPMPDGAPQDARPEAAAEAPAEAAPLPAAAGSGQLAPAAAVPDGPLFQSLPSPAEPDGVPPSASVPVVATPPVPLPPPPSSPAAAGVASSAPPALAEAVIPPGPPSPKPPPAAEATGSPAPPAFSRPERGPPGELAAAASHGGGLVAAESPPGEDGAHSPEVPVTPANAALPAAEGTLPAGDEPVAPPAPPGGAASPSATSAASPEARGGDPAPPEPLRPQVEPAPPETRPVEAAKAERLDERGASASSLAAAPVPDTAAGLAAAVAGPAAPQGRASAPPEAAALPPGPAPGTPPASQMVAILRRADAMLALRDVSAARLLYARAAAAGSGEAMLALGKVQDPLFLEEIGVRGIPGDAALAISWYRRAQARGIAEARDRLARHGVRPEE
jgi:hypothetical protein